MFNLWKSKSSMIIDPAIGIILTAAFIAYENKRFNKF